MALSRNKKNEVVEAVGGLLETSKLTVLAAYSGTSVKELQQLRRDARVSGTNVKVVKNRLVIKALEGNERLKGIDTSVLTGQILYAFNSQDEIAPAQVLASFAKTAPTLQFVGGITYDGIFINADDVRALASLPGKDQLRGMLIGTIAAPLGGFVNVMAGNVRGVLNVLNARAQIES